MNHIIDMLWNWKVFKDDYKLRWEIECVNGIMDTILELSIFGMLEIEII